MVLRIAHRGASGHTCENSLEAFERAIQLGVDIIELDVRHTKDGHPVVFHDKKVHRVSNGRGKIKKLTLKELQKLWLHNGERIVTLVEALALINNRCWINVEIKTKACRRTLDAIYTYTDVENVIVSSFNRRVLTKIKKLAPSLKIGFLRRYSLPFSNVVKACKQLKAYSFHPYHKNFTLTKRTVKMFHKHGIKVFPWHVEDSKMIRKLKKLGVDGIMSDRPERI